MSRQASTEGRFEDSSEWNETSKSNQKSESTETPDRPDRPESTESAQSDDDACNMTLEDLVRRVQMYSKDFKTNISELNRFVEHPHPYQEEQTLETPEQKQLTRDQLLDFQARLDAIKSKVERDFLKDASDSSIGNSSSDQLRTELAEKQGLIEKFREDLREKDERLEELAQAKIELQKTRQEIANLKQNVMKMKAENAELRRKSQNPNSNNDDESDLDTVTALLMPHKSSISSSIVENPEEFDLPSVVVPKPNFSRPSLATVVNDRRNKKMSVRDMAKAFSFNKR